MHKLKKIGVVLILVGLYFPLLMLAFATKVRDDSTMNYFYAMQHVNPLQEDIVDKIQNLEIILRKAVYVPQPDIRLPREFQEVKSEISISYKYVLAASVLYLFTGIGFLLLAIDPLKQA